MVAGYNADSGIEVSSVDSLRSLQYVTWVSAEESIQKTGVTKYEKGKAFEGINFYSSFNLQEAFLMGMSGNILHTWSKEIVGKNTWNCVKMCENGDLLVIEGHKVLARLDRDSNIIWKSRMNYHHDIRVADNKDIYALSSKAKMTTLNWVPIPALDDHIVVLSPDGEIKKEISLFNIIKDEIPSGAKWKIYRYLTDIKKIAEHYRAKTLDKWIITFSAHDIVHTNTIEILDKDIEGVCEKGSILFCSKNLDLIGIIDVDAEELVWKWGPGHLDGPHRSTLLENGNIMVFDNGFRRGYSRIIELNPKTGKIIWEYKADPPEEFFSPTRGSNQRLPNGNTLITESDRGRVFEITRNGEIVWEFYNPEINKKEKTRAAIYRFMRMPAAPMNIEGVGQE
ncbi:arylsulfotransferase family protein [Candidatus Omnitrophota bacterium]